MIRAVFDTNLLVSYLLTHRPPITTPIDHYLAREDILLVTAPELLDELNRVLLNSRHPAVGRIAQLNEATGVELVRLGVRTLQATQCEGFTLPA